MRSPEMERADLARRMTAPQRHRLLQGYPMAPLLLRRTSSAMPAWEELPLDSTRPLLVGVLPHPFCNPSVSGCGFCTFPHEKFDKGQVRKLASAVAQEIASTSERLGLGSRRVEAVYLGGGTANLTPADDLEALLAALGATFDLRQAEVTLEGAPLYFHRPDLRRLEALTRAPVGSRRISMGVQTFDRAWLERMGRMAFGAPSHVEEAVAHAQRLGMATSADLLFNLPGQSRQAMLDDVQRAMTMGFDQICIYNLVLVAGMGPVWSMQPELVAAMPSPEAACANWLALREHLLSRGYVQSTLTNFERAEVHAGPSRFRYEAASFQPQAYDGVGFGPGGLSTFTSPDGREAVKWQNATEALSYLGVARMGDPRAGAFRYSPEDLRLLHLTRGLCLLRVDRPAYAARFGSDLGGDFGSALAALTEAGLVELDARELRLTPRGMFFADAVTGLLAAERANSLRGDNRAVRHHMG